MQNFIHFFIYHRSLTHLLFLFLLLVAYFSYLKVPKEMFPPNALDKILISGYYGSASNAVLDRLIVQECESLLKEHPFVSEISSMITGGSYQITGDITDGDKKEQVIAEIETGLKALKEDLPSDFILPAVKGVEQFFPLMSISLFTDKIHHDEAVEVGKRLSEAIKKFDHIYQSEVVGKYEKVLEMSIDDKLLMAYSIDRDSVYQTISSIYSLFPIGDLTSDNERYFISTKSEDITLDEIRDYQIRIDGKVIRVGDIITLKYRYERHALLTKTDGKKALMINVKKAKAGDSIKLSGQIRTLIESYETRYPHIGIKVLSDSSFWIRTRLNVISSNVIIGLLLLFSMIWFLISLKIALVVLIGIPVSFAFGIIGLDIFDSSLNTLSMIGVLLSLGLLVDEAVVVSENIYRHKMLGKTTYQACLDGVSEILPVLFASMLTTVVAFLPLMMLSGGLGLFVKIIPLMVIILIISSFLESFIFLPLHYLNVDQKFSDKQRNWRDQFWDVINRQYQKSLYWMMRWRYSALVIFVVMTLVLTVVLSKSAKFQLFPEFDAMSIYVTGKVKHNDTKFTAKQTELLESLFLAKLNPEDVASVHTLVGMKTDGRGSHEKAKNLFTITLNLHPKRSEDFFNRVINPWFVLFGDVKQQPTRKLAAKELRREIEKIFTEYSSQMDDFVHTSINIPQTGVVQSDIAIQISDHDDQKIHETLGVLKDEIAKIEGVYNIKDDMKYDNIDLQIDINSYGKQLGFTQMDIIRSLRLYVEKDKFSKVLTRENEFVELKAGFLSTNNLDSFTNLQLRVPQSEKRVVLNDIATLWYIKKATVIKKENFEKRYTLQASLDKKIITSRVFYKKMNPLLKRLKNEGIKIIIKGEAQKKKEMQKDILKSVIFSLFGILLILTWVFKSFRLSLYALTPILLSLPGIFIGHMILGLNLTLSSILGGVGLIGIIVNDTALMLSFLQKSKDLNSLIAQATLRVKPILITSITTMLGFSTLIFFASGESLLMQPLAVSIGFGLIWATVVNLFYLPLGYSLGR